MPIAFQKAIVWALFYEIAGFGCSWGPMNGRFKAPMGGFLYFLRPGTTKLPLFPGSPVFGGIRRTGLDVASTPRRCCSCSARSKVGTTSTKAVMRPIDRAFDIDSDD